MLLSILIPVVIFGIPAVLALIGALRAHPPRAVLRNAKVLVLLGLGLVLPAILGAGGWWISRWNLADYNEVERQGDVWILRHSIKGTRRRLPKAHILRAELTYKITGQNVTAAFYRLRLHLVGGTHVDSDRSSYRPGVEQSICALGMVVKDVSCKKSNSKKSNPGHPGSPRR